MQLANKIEQDEAEMLLLKRGERRATPAKGVKESGRRLKAERRSHGHVYTNKPESTAALPPARIVLRHVN